MPAPIRRVDELGFPVPGKFDDQPDSPARPKRAWGSFLFRWRWAVLLIVLPFFFGRPLINGVREMVAQRMIRSAQIRMYQSRFPEALASADRALSWAPDSFEQWQAYQIRALIHQVMPNHAEESLADWNEVIKRLDDPARRKEFPEGLEYLREAYAQRASISERLGRHKEAVADATTAVNLAGDDGTRATFLNERAYVRALGNIELEQALQDVDQALRIAPDDAAMIDTRAYVLFRLGKNDAARKAIDDAIARWMQSRRGGLWIAGDNNSRRAWVQDDESFAAGDSFRENLAVMYHHRGEIRKKQGEEKLGDQDIRKAEAMGYDPERGVY